eukprot:GHUV01048172.1.p1 GENE.GHUV01048172.1~~GHUV01048172.1.p1  ORF type:complete len:101 (+),score=15.27 GHUV01048172.1:249-551(+)
MLISSMTTYRPLLLRIKQAYEAALVDAIASAYDHVHLQAELSLMPHKHVSSSTARHLHPAWSATSCSTRAAAIRCNHSTTRGVMFQHPPRLWCQKIALSQ